MDVCARVQHYQNVQSRSSAVIFSFFVSARVGLRGQVSGRRLVRKKRTEQQQSRLANNTEKLDMRHARSQQIGRFGGNAEEPNRVQSMCQILY